MSIPHKETTMPLPIFVGQPGQFGYMSFDDAKYNIVKALVEHAATHKVGFCRNFAILARCAGWKWRGKDVTHDDVCSTYDSLVNNCVDNINKITDDDIRGTRWHTSASTGRIHVTVLYYVNQNSIQVFITTDIIN
jgi:hypothetical protein